MGVNSNVLDGFLANIRESSECLQVSPSLLLRASLQKARIFSPLHTFFDFIISLLVTCGQLTLAIEGSSQLSTLVERQKLYDENIRELLSRVKNPQPSEDLIALERSLASLLESGLAFFSGFFKMWA
jgi:hypothetical protein